MTQNFESEQSKRPDKYFELEMVKVNVSEHFRYWSDLDEKGFSVLEATQNENGLYGIIVRNRNEDKFPKFAVMGELNQNPLEAAMSSVEKLESLVDKKTKHESKIDVLGNEINSEEVNAHIKQKIADGEYSSNREVECIGFSKNFNVNSSGWVSGDAYSAIFTEKGVDSVQFSTLPDDYLKHKQEYEPEYGEEKIINDFCRNGLSDLYEKKLKNLSKQAAEDLRKKFGTVIDELNVDMKVEAQHRFDKKDSIGYQVRMNHKIYPIFSRSQTNFPEADWSYYTARDEMKSSIEEHQAKLDTILNSDAKLKYMIGGMDEELCPGATLSDISNEKNYKSISVYIPSFPKELSNVSATGKDWDEVMKMVKQKYQETFEYLKDKNKKEEKDDGYINVTGLPTSMIFDLQDAGGPEGVNEILYEHLKNALKFESSHTRIPPYFNAEKLEVFAKMALSKEDYETAAKIRDHIKNKR